MNWDPNENLSARMIIAINTVRYDKRLSCQAKGLWLYLFFGPPGWEFSYDDLVYHCKDDERILWECLNKLRECGYSNPRAVAGYNQVKWDLS